MDTTDLAEVRRTLWAAADQMRANSTLGPAEYRGPVPEPILNDEDREQVKASAKRLLEHLTDKLVLDWRRKASATSGVKSTIKTILDEDLPADPYPPEVFDAKVAAIFDHVLTMPAGPWSTVQVSE